MEPETCPWLVRVGFEDDGTDIIRECGAPVAEDSYDGLCSMHTRGMPLDDYYAPGGPAWMEEEYDR